jgi:anti-sigma factor (TIGR02949 family)
MTSPNAEPFNAQASGAEEVTVGSQPVAHRHGGSDNPCQSALDGLYQYVDGEMSEEGRLQLEMHLRDCVGCENVFGFEFQVKRLIATRGRTPLSGRGTGPPGDGDPDLRHRDPTRCVSTSGRGTVRPSPGWSGRPRVLRQCQADLGWDHARLGTHLALLGGHHFGAVGHLARREHRGWVHAFGGQAPLPRPAGLTRRRRGCPTVVPT